VCSERFGHVNAQCSTEVVICFDPLYAKFHKKPGFFKSPMAINIVWFLDVQCIYMSLIAAGMASGIHLIASIIAAIRIGRWEAIIFSFICLIYTFVSCFIYTIILALTVIYTYQFTETNPEQFVIFWGLGFGLLYVILKIISSKYIK
jgi:hypothetical protein